MAESGPDMKEFGFTEDVLAGLLGTDMGLTDPDEIPEPAKDPAVRRGEVWLLGRHRLMCGDSLSTTDVARLTRGRMNLSITDPPFDMPAREQIRTLRLAGVRTAVIFGSGREFFRLANLDDLKYRFDFTIVYDRSVALAGKGSLMYRHNRILLADVEPEGNGPCSADGMVLGAGVNFDRGRYASVSGTHCSVLQAPVQRRIYGYGKCCDLFRTFVRAMDGDTVYDPFAGSGTCLVACEIEGKDGVGMELEPRVAEIAIRRWEAFTGERAVRE